MINQATNALFYFIIKHMWTRFTGVKKKKTRHEIEIHVVYLSNTYLGTKYTRV